MRLPFFLLEISYAILSCRFLSFHEQRLGTSLDLKPEVGRKSKFREICPVSIHYPSSVTACQSFVPSGDKRFNVSLEATL